MTPLWQHQQDALDFIADKPAALLAMGMGSGKSAVAINALERRGIDRALIVCPKSVASVWPLEFEKHASRPWRIETLADGKMAELFPLATLRPCKPPPAHLGSGTPFVFVPRTALRPLDKFIDRELLGLY